MQVVGCYRTAKQADAGGTISTAPGSRAAWTTARAPAKIRPDLDVEPADRVLAERVIAWARGSFPANRPVPFEANMGAFARLELVGPRDGMAAI